MNTELYQNWTATYARQFMIMWFQILRSDSCGFAEVDWCKLKPLTSGRRDRMDLLPSMYESHRPLDVVRPPSRPATYTCQVAVWHRLLGLHNPVIFLSLLASGFTELPDCEACELVSAFIISARS